MIVLYHTFIRANMFEGLTIALLIVIGLALVILEVIFVPGTTIVGFAGLAFGIWGIVLSFRQSTEIGWSVSLATFIVAATAFYAVFKRGLGKAFVLKNQLNNAVNYSEVLHVQAGDIGRTVSALRPMGTADFKGQLVEVQSLGQLIETGTEVRILSVEKRKVVVEIASS